MTSGSKFGDAIRVADADDRRAWRSRARPVAVGISEMPSLKAHGLSNTHPYISDKRLKKWAELFVILLSIQRDALLQA
jgi:hypothetical protein